MDWINLCKIERKTQDGRYCQHCIKSFRFSGFAFQADRPTKGFADRMISIFTRNEQGRRPAHGWYEKFQTDPHWRDLVLFYEYFHGDTGMGLGASHQTGWTGLVASLIDEWRR